MILDQIIYGLNISNANVTDNYGKGVFLERIRDRTVIRNATIARNQHIAGIHVRDGAADIWINDTIIENNYGDGINITFAGGSVIINGTSLSNNTMRGCAFHYNDTGPFMPLKQEIIFIGRRGQSDYIPTYVNGNRWGGILVGNFCANAWNRVENPKLIISYVTFRGNIYHPAFEYHSCQRENQPQTTVEFTGSRCEHSDAFCIRVQPAVNLKLTISDSNFLQNDRSVLIVRNTEFPQLAHLPSEVNIFRNNFKRNVGPFIATVGLNEDAPLQHLSMKFMNVFTDNTVLNPYPHLNPRYRPMATLIVSSSNVDVVNNCFMQNQAQYDLATDLGEHAKVINATVNAFGTGNPQLFMPKIFDGTKRYTLATFNLDPYAVVCNDINPIITPFNNQYLPPFRDAKDQNRLGGLIYQNFDMPRGTYTVYEDLHVMPGAILRLAPGTKLEFENGIGMLIQGQLLRTEYDGDGFVNMTGKIFTLPSISNIRLVDDEGIPSMQGRLEVRYGDDWGTVCNRSWNVNLAAMVCNQLGMVIDPEFLENWWLWPEPGLLPVVMDIIRCEELETDITRCRHEGIPENVAVGCPRGHVVGVRCVPPKWAGIRYTLLADPPSVTEQEYMHHLEISEAGLLDYSRPEFTAAIQIDWNYHYFSHLRVEKNFWNGLDIVYNDLVKKPKITNSHFNYNRRHGVRARSYGLTMEYSRIDNNENAGFRYNPILSPVEQNDVVTWLFTKDPLGNRIIYIPDKNVQEIRLDASRRDTRKFLLAYGSPDCPQFIPEGQQCTYQLTIISTNIQSGADARVGIQIVNRPLNDSDETVIFQDGPKLRTWNVRDDLIRFPIVTEYNRVTMTYKRSYGRPAVIILLFYLDGNYSNTIEPFLIQLS